MMGFELTTIYSQRQLSNNEPLTIVEWKCSLHNATLYDTGYSTNAIQLVKLGNRYAK